MFRTVAGGKVQYMVQRIGHKEVKSKTSETKTKNIKGSNGTFVLTFHIASIREGFAGNEGKIGFG